MVCLVAGARPHFRGVDDAELEVLLRNERYPRSAGYSARWMVDNGMGPNPVWQAESLTELLRLEPGMRVLDLGCGAALSSIFLAKEFGVEVWATDLWVKPDENLRRAAEAQVEDRPGHRRAR
jgi:cyclopropane fatty-acyl-phospholipid synthase-like methyltransferase